MRVIRASWRRRMLTCLRTSRKVAVAWREKSSRRDQDGVGGHGGGGQRLGGEQVLQRQDVDGCLHGRGGDALLVGLPVDDRERLDLDRRGTCRRPGTRRRRVPGRRDGRRPAAAASGGHTGCPPRRVPGRAQQQCAVSAGSGLPGWCCRRRSPGRCRRPRGAPGRPFPQQPDQVRAAVGLDLRLEDRPAGERERGLRSAGRCGNPACVAISALSAPAASMSARRAHPGLAVSAATVRAV